MKDILIVGASGFGREVLQIIKDINKKQPTWNIKGFLDDNLDALDGYDCDYKIVGTIQDYQPQANDVFALALAFPEVKTRVVNMLEAKGAEFVSIIHPNAEIGSFNKIGKGVVVYPFARVTVNAELGDYSALLSYSMVAHDARLGAYSTACSNVQLNGHVKVGDRVFIGGMVAISPSTTVGDDVFICTGSVVISNVKPGYKVFGNPAKKINF